MSRGYRRVGGEDTAGSHLARGLIEWNSARRQLTDALHHHERGVTLVRVPVAGLDAQSAQEAHATDPEHDLLPQPVLGVTAIEARGELAGPLRVTFDIRVEEVDRHAPDLDLPDRQAERATAVREVDLDV